MLIVYLLYENLGRFLITRYASIALVVRDCKMVELM